MSMTARRLLALVLSMCMVLQFCMLPGGAAYAEQSESVEYEFDDSRTATSFVKTGAGSLVLDGALALNGLDVQAGSVTLTDKMQSVASSDATLSLASGVTLALDYDGQMPFKTLTVGGIECGTGIYSATKGAPRVKKCLGGTGELCILTGSGPGCVIKIR